MTEFYVDMRDLRFNLFDFLNVGSMSEHERFADYDAEVMDDVLGMAEAQAKELLAPINQSGDEEGLKLVDGKVITPKGFKEAYKEFAKAGWVGLTHNEPDYGGQGFPFVMGAAVDDLFIGANLSFFFTPGLSSGAARMISAFGTKEQKDAYLEKMLSGAWGGTMALTEPNAGSAVPDLKTTATPTDREGIYKIKGQKIFITSGEHDMTENIVHAVLARIDGDPPGSKGVSLFIVPKLRPKLLPNGKVDIGEPNDVTCVGIEEKLGIHASPTTQLAFGDEDDCEGWLLGGQGNGLRCMFQMMNEARIGVGLQGESMANVAYQQAKRYAAERVQGVAIQNMRDVNAPRVPIIEHPDVRRMLASMKATAEGARALCLYGAFCADQAELAEGKEAQKWEYQAEILTPIIKAWCSDEGFRVAETGVQVLGGYGYVREYGLEQILRDVKIASIYEGTNGIQALDLLGRKVGRKGGVMLMTMLNRINGFLKGNAEGPFAAEVAKLAEARDALAKTAMGFAKRSMKGDVLYGALYAVPFLQMFGDVAVAWLLLEHAQKAHEMFVARAAKLGVDPEGEGFAAKLADDAELAFLHGKCKSAKFFVWNVLPRLHARKATIDSNDTSALEMVF